MNANGRMTKMMYILVIMIISLIPATVFAFEHKKFLNIPTTEDFAKGYVLSFILVFIIQAVIEQLIFGKIEIGLI